MLPLPFHVRFVVGEHRGERANHQPGGGGGGGPAPAGDSGGRQGGGGQAGETEQLTGTSGAHVTLNYKHSN